MTNPACALSVHVVRLSRLILRTFATSPCDYVSVGRGASLSAPGNLLEATNRCPRGARRFIGVQIIVSRLRALIQTTRLCCVLSAFLMRPAQILPNRARYVRSASRF
jgi:hypothetical protein